MGKPPQQLTMNEYKRCYYLFNKHKLIEYSKNYYTYKKCNGDFTNLDISDNMRLFLSKYKQHSKKDKEKEKKISLKINKGDFILCFN